MPEELIDLQYSCPPMDSASRFKITNGEFLRFVRGRGYSNPKYWSAEGWGWKTFRNVKWPTFWIPDGPQGLHRWVWVMLRYDCPEGRFWTCC